MSLFTLIYEGSSAPSLNVVSYGGLLFRPGDPKSTDATMRAIAIFESLKDMTISDGTIYKLLQRLKTGKLKIKQGRASRWVAGPVDFSELRTEYIGPMHQGLLDFNLHKTNQPMIFLNIGQEPVLPLNQLEEMPDAKLKDLLKKLSTEKGTSSVTTDEEGEAEVDAEVGATSDAGSEDAEEVWWRMRSQKRARRKRLARGRGQLTEEERLRLRVERWALKAVEVAELVKKPKGKRADDLYFYEQEKTKQARKLIKQTLDSW